MFRDKRVNHSFHYFLQISPLFFSYLNLMATELWHFSKLLYEEDAEGHHNTAYRNIRTVLFTSSDTLPKYTQQPSFVSVQEAECQGQDISTGTQKQQDYSQQTLKIENGRPSETGEAPATSPFWARGKRGVQGRKRHAGPACLSRSFRGLQVLF